MLEKVKQLVYELLGNDKSGHGVEHINRVLNISLAFTESENADPELVTLIALLHDVDDRKLFQNIDNSKLPHARKIMQIASINPEIQKQVCDELSKIGYHKRLDGIIPTTLEGKIVSDADMCDCLGASGIIRACLYGAGRNLAFFNKDSLPRKNLTSNGYVNNDESCGINHIFEKCLTLNKLMLTEPGRKLADARRQVTINFLYNFFEEENVPEWTEYLTNYLKNS